MDWLIREETRRRKPVYHVGRSQGLGFFTILSLSSLSDLIQPKGFKWYLFADDAQMCSSSPHSSLPYALDLVAYGLDDISIWMPNRHLRLNMSKSETLLSLPCLQICSFPALPISTSDTLSAQARNLNGSPILLISHFCLWNPNISQICLFFSISTAKTLLCLIYLLPGSLL